MFKSLETGPLAHVDIFDVSQFREEHTLGNGIPLALQLKGFNRMERIVRRNNQIARGERGSTIARSISEGAIMIINDLTGCDFLSAHNSEYTLRLPDSRGITTCGNSIYIGSVNRIHHFDTINRTVTTLHNPWFAFIHSLELSDDASRILVASAGFDRIMEVDTATGEPIWEWSAWTHGYPHTISTHRTIATSADFSNGVNNPLVVSSPNDYPEGIGLPPGDRTAFPNRAIYLDENSILTTLFHYGLIKIDRETGDVTPILDNLSHPHGIRKYKSGFIVTDTANGVCIILDRNLLPTKVFSFRNLPDKSPEAESGEWLQQVIPFGDGLLAAIDSNRTRLYVLDIDNMLRRSIPYDPNWAMHEVCPLSPQLEKGLMQFD